MKINLKALCIIVLLLTLNGCEKKQKACGWFDNPTPANYSLIHKNGEWILGMQGGFQYDTDDKYGNWWPQFKEEEFVKTNYNYGYGCVCLEATIDKKTNHVKRIFSTQVKPLKFCIENETLVLLL